MTKTLSDQDRARLDGLIAEMEKRTKTQIVLAVINRCDNYAELPWIAFALGASLAGLLVLIFYPSFYSWSPGITGLITVSSILGAGAIFAVLTVLAPGMGKLFLSSHRAETEVRQYAESLFLNRELFNTSQRTGILFLVSVFERKIVILPDKGIQEKLNENELNGIIAVMAPLLKRHRVRKAFESGLARLTKVVGSTIESGGENELPDAIIEENGV